MAIGPIGYPTIQSVDSLVRSLVQDDYAGATETIGEGQIYVDNTTLSVTLSNFFNSAMRTMCRKLRTTTGPMLIYDNYIFFNVPPINSSSPDPALQVYIGYTGYNDGLTTNPDFALPSNVLLVERVWERLTGSNTPFQSLTQARQGLPSVYQNLYNRIWEWRNDAINMPGSITATDIRIRYQGQLAQIYNNGIDTSSTYIPINDCQDCLAGLIIQQIGIRQGATVLPAALEWSADQINDFLNEQIKRDQGQPYQVVPFNQGEDNGHY